MRIRTLLLSSVVFGSVAMLASASWSQTSPKVVYKPQGNWSVTRMAAKGPGKDPYCTMARRFGDNVVLTFARNAKDETSLAMDFQPDTLAKGQTYYVVLDAGSDQKRAFDVSPVSDKAMIIRLGQDEKFHDALNNSGVLNVDVAGLQFEFSVPDMTKGQEDLGNCIATVVQPASGETVKTAAVKPAPVPVREPVDEPMKMATTPMPMEEEVIEAAPLKKEDMPKVRRMSDDILAAPATKMMREVPDDLSMPPVAALAPMPSETSRASAENDKQGFEAQSLREENMRLKNALTRERREYEERSMKESSGSSQVSEVMEKMKILETENSDLKYRLADARSSGTAQPTAPVSAADPKLEEEVAKLRDENATLQSKITAQLLAKGEIDPKAAEEISKLREENATLQSQVLRQKTTGGDTDSKLAAEIAKLRDENATLKANPAKALQAGADPKMASEIAILRQENASLKADMASKKVDALIPTPELSDEIAILKDENNSLRDELSAQKMAMASLEPKAGQKATKAADPSVIARMQARIDDLSAQNDKLQSDIVSAQITAAPVTPVTKDNGITVSQLRSVEEQLRAVENERNNLRAQIEKANDNKEDGLIKLSGSDWNLEQATRRFNEAEREIRRLGSQLEQSRAQCTTEKKEIEYMLFDPEIANQEQISKLMSLEKEVDAAKAEIARKDAEVSNLQAKLSSPAQRMASITPAAGVSSAPVERVAVAPVSVAPVEAPVPTPPPMAAVPVPAPIPTPAPVAAAPVVAAPVAAQEVEAMEMRSLDEEIRPRSVRFDPVAAPNIRPAAVGANVVARAPAVSQEPLMPMGNEMAVEASPAPQPVMQQPAVQVVTKASPNAPQATPSVMDSGTKLLTADALSSQLRQSGLTLSGDVKKIDKVSGPAFVAYSWNTDGLFGTAEQKPMANPEQFQTMVNQYLDKTKSRCSGDFAASPVPTQSVAGVSVASYEVACIGTDGTGATAALAFYGKDGLFTTVAHESGMDTMDTAMDARDRVIAGLASNKTTN